MKGMTMRDDRLPKLCGADIELGGFILGGGSELSGDRAARAVLREIPGLPLVKRYHPIYCDCEVCRTRWRGMGWTAPGFSTASPGAYAAGADPLDTGRKFLPANGGCAYIDLSHLELCLPEVLTASDHVACWHAMLRIAERARAAAAEKLRKGERLEILVNNSDGLGNAYGSHLDVLMTRRAWDELHHRKLHLLQFLATYQVSAIIFTGQGKVGSENGAPPVTFQLSQRADFFETLHGIQTTHRRPIVNTRDEPLCGFGPRTDPSSPAATMAREHVIFFDNTLAPVASYLKVGVLQIILAMIEAGEVEPDLALEDPIDAAVRFSHDLGLKVRAPLVSGRMVSAVELQTLFHEHATQFAERGGLEGIVPEWKQILRLWGTILDLLAAGDLDALARRLDWALKLKILLQALGSHRRLDWSSAELKHLDQAYSSLDPAQGLYWTYEREGLVERVVPEERIEWFTKNPPEDTRAWTRAMLLRRAGAEAIDDVDWDFVRVRDGGRRWTVRLDDPFEGRNPEVAAGIPNGGTLEDTLTLLGATPAARTGALALGKIIETNQGGSHDGTRKTAI